jgi:hypothetical protein
LLNGKTNNHSDSARHLQASMPRSTMGTTAPIIVELAKSERQLLLRIASIVRQKDPDMLVSWDTQGAGLGYIIERGAVLGKDGIDPSRGSSSVSEIDMARLLGRTPSAKSDQDEGWREWSKPQENDSKTEIKQEGQWKGSGLGTDWDERVGAGAAAASIVGHILVV